MRNLLIHKKHSQQVGIATGFVLNENHKSKAFLRPLIPVLSGIAKRFMGMRLVSILLKKTYFYNIVDTVLKIILALAAFLVISKNTFAQSNTDWWFDVEVIVFTRTLEPTNNEDYTQADFTFQSTSAIDLFSLPITEAEFALHNVKMGMSLCEPPKDPIQLRIEQFSRPIIELEEFNKTPAANSKLNPFNSSEDGYLSEDANLISVGTTIDTWNSIKQETPTALYPLMCLQAFDQTIPLRFQGYERVPEAMFAAQSGFTGHHYLLDNNNLRMSQLARKVIGQRDIQALLHTAWRQQVVFGEDNAQFVRIIAGEYLTLDNKPSYEELNERYLQKQESEVQHNQDLLTQIEAILENPPKTDWIKIEEQREIINSEQFTNENEQEVSSKWNLEGLFKVYLKNVNQIPYLHIDSELKHHRIIINENGKAEFSVFPFKQRRRIISKQIHYFDHPAFGMIVRLDRFTPPAPDDHTVVR